jgi:hypothetical protein
MLELTHSCFVLDYGDEWTLNRPFAGIEWLERIFLLPDTRPLSASDLAAANRRHDEAQISSPWFRLWHDTECVTDLRPQ